MLKEILLNKWFFSFVISWTVFLLLVDWNTFSRNFWGGIAASILELWQDTIASIVGMYHIQDGGFFLFRAPIFLTFGAVFTVGVLFLQYLPQNPKLQLLHIIMISAGFAVFEVIVESFGLLIKPHWNLLGSFFDNTIIMGSLAWLKQYILYKSRAD